MSEENVVEKPEEEQEVIKVDTPEEESEHVEPETTEKPEETKKRASAHLKDAIKQVESFGQALGEALQGRANVVMVRVNDESLKHLDMLVEAEITSSRSESAAFMISEGIKANQALFDKISAITEQIAELREQLRQEVNLQQPKPEPEEETSEEEDES
jgi:uncharacterized FlaG/YvyC family protein